MFLPHFDVFCDLLLNRRMATWNLFVLYNNEKLFYFKIFQHTRKGAQIAHKKAIWRNLLSIQNEVISLAKMHSNELWLVPENHATVKTWLEQLERLSSWNENLQQKQNWAAKCTNFKESAGKVKSIFVIRAALWAEKLGRCVKYCRSWENTLRKLVVAVNLKAILIRVLNERSICDGGNFWFFCGWWFLNQFDIMSETHFSCDTVGRGLWLAILCSLLCPEMDWNTRIAGKARLCVYFNGF